MKKEFYVRVGKKKWHLINFFNLILKAWKVCNFYVYFVAFLYIDIIEHLEFGFWNSALDLIEQK